MNFGFDVDLESMRLVEDEVNSAAENVWWVGKPNPWGIAKSQVSIFQLGFMLFFFGVLFFIGRTFLETFGSMSSSFGSSPFGGPPDQIFRLFPYFFGLIFVLILFNALRVFLEPVWQVVGSFFTVYAITNKRCLLYTSPSPRDA